MPNCLCFSVFLFLHPFTGTVTPKMLEEEENVNAIRQLTEQFDEVRS